MRKLLLAAFLGLAAPAAAQYPTPTFQSTTVLGNHSVAGTSTLSGGGTLSGTWAGNPTFSGNLTHQGTSAFQGTTTIGTNTTAANTVLNGPAGAQRIMQWSTAGSPRWRFIANATAESGANAGSDLQLFSFSDVGASLGSQVSMFRSNGNWTWNGNNNFSAPTYNFHGVVFTSTDSFEGAGALASASGVPFNPGSASKPVFYALTNYTGVWDSGGTSPYFYRVNDAINADAASFLPSVFLWDYEYNTGAGNGRTPFNMVMNKNATDVGGTTNDNTFVALTVKGNININEGDSTPNYRGDYEALNLDIQCKADWMRVCIQAEVDHGLFAGMHARTIAHMAFNNQQNDAAHGTLDDTFFMLQSSPNITNGTGGRTTVFQLGSTIDIWPLDPTLTNSAILAIYPYQYNNPIIHNLGQPVSPTLYKSGFGFDLFYLNCTTGCWRSPGFTVDGGGQHFMGPTSLTYDASGNATLAETRVRETSAVVNAAGDHYKVGDQIADTNGGLWNVATLTGTGIATVTQIQPGYATSCPGAGNAVTAGSGQLATLNITCASLGNLILGASTHNVRIGGGSALATNATTGMLLIPSMAGTPTGNVGALGGVALNYDSTNKKLCVTIGATVECTAAMTP